MTNGWHVSKEAIASLGASQAKMGWMLTIPASLRRLATARLAAFLGRTDLPHLTELAALHPTQRALLAGFAGWIILTLLVTTVAVVFVETSGMRLQSRFNATSPEERGREVRVSANFDDILQRPLFSRSRQSAVAVPIQMSPSPSVAPPVDREFILKGVFMNGSSASAFLLSPEEPLGVWVRSGEEMSGWTVVTVWPDQVLLKGQGETRTVWLDYRRKK